MQLPDAQVAVLNAASADESRTVESLADELDRKPEAVTRAAFELEDAGLVAVTEAVEETVTLTDEARPPDRGGARATPRRDTTAPRLSA